MTCWLEVAPICPDGWRVTSQGEHDHSPDMLRGAFLEKLERHRVEHLKSDLVMLPISQAKRSSIPAIYEKFYNPIDPMDY